MNSLPSLIGRFAPSPTGRLHLGNLRTALLAWLSIRLQGGKFILRIEDIDQPRVVDGSADQILYDLEWLGLDWDGPIVFQSQRTELYEEALKKIEALNLTYSCFCSRKEIQASIIENRTIQEYTGVCSNLSDEEIKIASIKKTPSTRVRVTDSFLQQSIGDFVIQRADSLFAYQLVVTVDDLDQGVTEVLRGADLIDSTPKQQYLASLLEDGMPIQYLHAPLMRDHSGNKMSKRDGSYSLSQWQGTQKSPERLIAYLLSSAGLISKQSSISIEEILNIVDLAQLQDVLISEKANV